MMRRIKLSSAEAFKLMRVFFQLLYGTWKISKLEDPIVSIFGGARLMEDQDYFKQAQALGERFAQNGISVLTGGGPGVMEAASCGVEYARERKGHTIGIGVRNLGEGKNKCVEEYFELDYFFARKWLLSRYSAAFIVFPGGFGTLDELTEVLTLIQTKRLTPRPIVLVGIEYWQPFMKWVTDEALKHQLISNQDIQLFTVTDDLEHAFCVVRDECKSM